MKNKLKVVGVVTGIILILILVILVTYKYLDYNYMNNICTTVEYENGSDIIKGTLSNKNKLSLKLKVKLKDNCETNIGTIYLNTKDILLEEIYYQVLEGTTEVSKGIIKNIGSTPIYKDFTITNEEKEYTVYLWLNKEDISIDYTGSISLTMEGR